jgi:predicted  nucleic acid-binding Zn-ribbon protein
MSSEDARLILEHVDSQFDRINEALKEIQKQVAKIPSMTEEIAEVRDDMRAVKAAIAATNEDVQDHERRLSKLETSAA